MKGANAAAPGFSNHGSGLAVDIHPGPIQEVFKSDGPAWGWSWDEGRDNGENWHFVFVGGNRYADRGWLDHAWVQKVVGAEVDGKIGTGTVEKIKAYQREHGLEADGIVGPGTKKVMLGKGSVAPAPSGPAGGTSKPVPAPSSDLPALPEVETSKTSPNKNTDRRGHDITSITVHWWGTPSGQSFDGIVNWLCDPKAQVSAHYVINPSRVARIVDEEHRSWANGNADGNSSSITIECDPNDIPGTLPVLAALIADIRSRHGDLPIYPHKHWTSTQCPGDYLPHLDAVDKAARTGKAIAPSPGTSKPAPKPKKVDEDGRLGRETVKALQGILGVTQDGRAGTNTWKALQTLLGTTVDGFVSHQSYAAKELGNGVVPGAWRHTGRGSKGSKMVKALQKKLGVKADGIWYESTTAALQRAINAGAGWLKG